MEMGYLTNGLRYSLVSLVTVFVFGDWVITSFYKNVTGSTKYKLS